MKGNATQNIVCPTSAEYIVHDIKGIGTTEMVSSSLDQLLCDQLFLKDNMSSENGYFNSLFQKHLVTRSNQRQLEVLQSPDQKVVTGSHCEGGLCSHGILCLIQLAFCVKVLVDACKHTLRFCLIIQIAYTLIGKQGVGKKVLDEYRSIVDLIAHIRCCCMAYFEKQEVLFRQDEFWEYGPLFERMITATLRTSWQINGDSVSSKGRSNLKYVKAGDLLQGF